MNTFYPVSNSTSTSFNGFKPLRANFTAVPNQFFDKIVGHYHPCIERVVGILIRATLGWENPDTGERKMEAEIPMSAFVRPELSLSSARKGIAGAIEAGFIVETFSATNKQAARYALRWEDEAAQSKAIERQRKAYNTHKRRGAELATKPKWKTKSRGVTVTPQEDDPRGPTTRGVTIAPPLIKKSESEKKEIKKENKLIHSSVSPTVSEQPKAELVGEFFDSSFSSEKKPELSETQGLALSELLSIGMSRKSAESLVRRYSLGRIRLSISSIPSKCDTTSRRLAWLTQCLKENWGVGTAPCNWTMQWANVSDDITRLVDLHGIERVVEELDVRARKADQDRCPFRAVGIRTLAQGLRNGLSVQEAVQTASAAAQEASAAAVSPILSPASVAAVPAPMARSLAPVFAPKRVVLSETVFAPWESLAITERRPYLQEAMRDFRSTEKEVGSERWSKIGGGIVATRARNLYETGQKGKQAWRGGWQTGKPSVKTDGYTESSPFRAWGPMEPFMLDAVALG